jgi:hypothetical protein
VAPVTTAEEFLRLDDPHDYELMAVGFELDQSTSVDVQAVGLRPRRADDLTVYAWILDATTREPVWEMDRRDTGRVRGSRVLREAKESLDLDTGRYELYFFSGSGRGGGGIVWGNWGDWWNWGDDDTEDLDRERRDCYVSLSGPSEVRTFEVDGGFPDALMRFTRAGDSERYVQGFELSRTMNLHLYSLIEHPKGDRSPADFAWIVNADDREVVWQTTKRNTRRAGGGDKNRVFNRDVELKAGRYVLYYGTDDSHSYEEFNVNPPFDPLNWGVVVSPGEGFRSDGFSLFDVEERTGEGFVDFTRAGDNDFFEQAIRVQRAGSVRVYALGEFDHGNRDFVDWAWIVNAENGDLVWEMTWRNTLPAGGAEKNRMFDGLVELAEGDYIVYYVTDGSHSYDHWNSAAPIDERAWGASVFLTGSLSDGDVERIAVEDVAQGEGVLARLVRARDHDRMRQRFTIEEDGYVHIYAIGEGVYGEMYDYAYIVDEAADRVEWEMEYRDTDHAGGARKNRVFDDEVFLRAGEYEAVYVTDGSHSFEGWNARKPDDPMGWGVTVQKSDGSGSSRRERDRDRRDRDRDDRDDDY